MYLRKTEANKSKRCSCHPSHQTHRRITKSSGAGSSILLAKQSELTFFLCVSGTRLLVSTNRTCAPKAVFGRQIAYRLSVLVTGLFWLVLAHIARADVIEIRRDGETTTYDQPTIFTSEGVMPIARPTAPNHPQDRAPTSVALALEEAGGQTALSPLLLEAIAWAESRFDHHAVSEAGARGVMQLMPETAVELGVDANDARANISGGAVYIKRMLDMFNGDLELALAAYNAGPATVRRYGGVPPYRETQNYIAAIMDYMATRAEEVSP